MPQRSQRRIGFLTALLLLASSFAGAQAQKKNGPDFHVDFRSQDLPDTLQVFGVEASEFVMRDREGLRITLPKGRKNLQPVGVRTTFPVRGDFEFTVALEILQAETPREGLGVGASMYINKTEHPKLGATIFRLVRPKGREVVMWDRALAVPGEKMQFPGGDSPCSDRILRLRLKRTGKQLAYLWSPGTSGDDFKLIHDCDFGDEEIKQITLRATTVGQPCFLDMRFLDLRLRSGAALDAPNPVAAPKVAAVNARSGSRMLLVVVLLAGMAVTLVLAICIGVWLYVRRRHAAEIDSPT